MSIKHTITINDASDSGVATLTGSQTEVGNSEIPINQTFAAGSSAVAVSGMAFTAANLQSIYVVADKACSITFTGPAVTVALVAGTPYYWQRSPGYFAIPFGSNVTGATLTSTPSVTLKARVLVS
jgi:hypothetical protein